MAYLAPIHRPSSVRHALKLSFLAPDADNLVLAKANRLEIYSPNPADPTQLLLQHTKTIYGKATLLHKLRPAKSPTDHLFVGTDRYHYFTLSWDAATNQLVTEKSYHDIADKSARDSQTGDRVHIDPTARFLTLECHEGVVNVLPIAHAGKGKRKAADNEIGELGDPIPVRVPEMFVKSSCFLQKRDAGAKQAPPELALLWEDTNQSRVRLKVRRLDYTPSLQPQKEPGSVEMPDEGSREVSGEIELGATHLIPLPASMYGMLVVGETRISYVEEWEYGVKNTVALEEATVWVAWCAVDDQRYVLADDYGKLYLLFVQQNGEGEYAGHQIDVLGETSRASTLVYLDGGRIFVGSHQGDSQIIQISEKSLEVVQTFANIAPILDFTVMDMGNRSSDAPVNEFSSGQARIVTGSGAFKDGSLRSVRSGVGLEDLGSIGEMGALVSGIFSLRSHASAELDDTLVVSFVGHSRVFTFSADGEVEEVEAFRAFTLDESTLYASSLPDGRVVQVTGSGVFLSDVDSGMVTESWSPGITITAVSGEGVTVLVSLGGAALAALDLSASSIRVQAQREFDASEQVSCIALSHSTPGACVVGFWKDSKVSFLDLQTLQPIATETVADDDSLAVPRSLIVANLLPGQPATLFVGLADGNVVTYSIESLQRPFTARKSIILGTQQANFALLPRADGLQNVFATCEHPSLIYGSDGRIVYSAVTAEDASCICSFDSAVYPNAIALAAEGELKLAMVDEGRTTHVQTLPVNETVRRIAYSAELKAFGLGTIKRTLKAGEEQIVSHFKLVDEVAFQELHSFQLNEDELIECCMRCPLDDGSGGLAERFVVGTAFLDDADSSSTRGRLLVFEVTPSRQLKLITEHALKGACRCLGVVQGKIVAALIKTVVVYSFEYETPSTPFLVKRAAYRTATAPIDISITDKTIAVTDLMKSLSLVEYRPGRSGMPDTLVEVARHFETLWGTAVAHVAENTYLESDAEGNLLVLQHDINGFNDEDRRRLRVTSEMLLGEMVNRIRRIDVVPTPGATVIPRAFIATVEGSIYLFGLIAPGKQDLLIRLQGKMAELVKSPGHVSFARFRGFRNQVRDAGEEGPSRFVDGELIEGFLELDESVQESVVAGLPGGLDLEGVRGMVEGLRRMH
ncbi:mono-functional DNA-alkylating methyl methanesulfonate N-term-domain-containing protein [Neohortaea acidophila]|uniref:DNA damage-binding protein 1 n=1 Tax=Neohortaea acidophila TaxID=245834 RepID=A0A6A6PSE3_9PEZI|nr:mono-functional DNA-alkylating methyl methanesulfonate N-term-domain-containing protein [Neohortaea acidophila]KAF2482902.1 mono-functional DNA-alkylating methyl methanesulfonate N-term-domain-containing protein [Neohortaea acidophila]